MRALNKLLFALLVLAAVLVGVEIAHPRGVGGMLDDVLGSKRAAEPSAATPPAATKPAEKPADAPRWGPGATKQLSWGDRDFDKGDFDGAVANFSSSRTLAANEDERNRAVKGLEKSLLAWALLRDAPAVKGSPDELSAQYLERLSKVERTPSEQAWLDLARFAAGAGLRERLPYVVGQTLDAARPGGFVQGRLEEAVQTAGHRRGDLTAAMASRGLAKGPPLGTLPVPGPHATAMAPDDEPSGIGGVNERGIPFGAFSADTRAKLREAVQLEMQAAALYRQAGPDSPHRAEHRHDAIECLKKARDAYQKALEEDPQSRDLDERLRDVLKMLAQLKKDEGIGLR